MELSPSLAIGKHLKRAVEAMFAGNGYFAVKDCEIIDRSYIVPSMHTNSTNEIQFNGVATQIRKLVASLGVIPSEKKCLNSPLIKFRLHNTDRDMIGQLMRDGRINVKQIGGIENCIYDRVMAFNLGNRTHFFRNYDYLTSEWTEKIIKMKQAVETGGQLLKTKNYAGQESPLRDFIYSLVIININDPLKEKKFKHTPVGSINGGQINQLYEKTASQSSVLDLMFEKSRTDHATKIWKESRITDYTGGTTGGFLDGLFDLAESSADRIVHIADKIAEGAADVSSELGDSIASIGKGIGEGVAGVGTGLGEGVAGLGTGLGEGVAGLGEGLGNGTASLDKVSDR